MTTKEQENPRNPWPGYLGAMFITVVAAANFCAAIDILRSGGSYSAIPCLAGGIFTAWQSLNILQKHT
jgi:hypothetical protein